MKFLHFTLEHFCKVYKYHKNPISTVSKFMQESPPQLNPVEKWVLWYLVTEPGPSLGIRNYPAFIVPEQLVGILPRPLLDYINDVKDTEEIMEGLTSKGLVNFSAPYHYSISNKGVLIFRKYVLDELIASFSNPEIFGIVLKKAEKDGENEFVKELKDVAKNVKDKAKDDAAEFILSKIKTAGGLFVAKILSSVFGN